MDWSSLLCRKRLRKILDDKGSSSDDDHRTEFEKDYDRVIYSTPFRRLQDKAQVFPLESHDSVHTRLAHSMEVARVARGLVQKVSEEILLEKDEIYRHSARDLVKIAEVCGLIHDFGNPPFGHAGEEAMRDWFRSKLLTSDGRKRFESGNGDLRAKDFTELGESLWEEHSQYVYDFLRFDGNAHTIRLLSRLQVVAHYRGLNLTAGTMSAALKYLPPSHKADERNHLYDKPGYMASEQEVVDEVRQATGVHENRNPITVLVEAADDIVNSLIDLEDAVRKGELTWDGVKRQLRSRMKEKGRHPQFDDIRECAEKIVDNGEAELGKDEGEAQLRMFRTIVIGEHVEAVTDRFNEKYAQIMKGDYPLEILDDENTETSELAAACTGLKFDRVIPSRDVIKLEYMGRNVMQDLMDMFWEGAEDAPGSKRDFNKKIYNLSSQNYRSVFENTGKSLPNEYQRLQLVADQVCGMTDSYACQLHRELTNR